MPHLSEHVELSPFATPQASAHSVLLPCGMPHLSAQVELSPLATPHASAHVEPSPATTPHWSEQVELSPLATPQASSHVDPSPRITPQMSAQAGRPPFATPHASPCPAQLVPSRGACQRGLGTERCCACTHPPRGLGGRTARMHSQKSVAATAAVAALRSLHRYARPRRGRGHGPPSSPAPPRTCPVRSGSYPGTVQCRGIIPSCVSFQYQPSNVHVTIYS